jgi:hypothetical protein
MYPSLHNWRLFKKGSGPWVNASSAKALHSYSRTTSFESRPWHRLSYLPWGYSVSSDEHWDSSLPRQNDQFFLKYLPLTIHSQPVTVAALSKAWHVFAQSNTGIVGSNPTQGMDVCVRLLCLCCSVCTYRLCDGLITRPRSPTDCV